MSSGNTGRLEGVQFAPPMAEHINTLGRYPYTMACLLAHIAIGGAAETNELREKIKELAQGETIEQPLDAKTLNGSRAILQVLGLLEIEETDPGLITRTKDVSIQQALPLIGVLGGLHCETPSEPDIRPLLTINHNSGWTIHMRMKFFDLLIKAKGGLYASNAGEQLGMLRNVFREQIRWFEKEGIVIARRIWNGRRIEGIKLALSDDFYPPMTRLLAQYRSLWSEPGRRGAAARACTILDRPHEFAQLLNTGTAPRRDANITSLRAWVRAKTTTKAEKIPSSFPELDPDVVAMLNQLGGSPLDISYILAHCRQPRQWLSPKEAAGRIEDGWAEGLKPRSRWARLRRVRARLVTTGMLESDTEAKTRLTPKGTLEGVPIAGVLTDWWLDLPIDAKSRRLLEDGTQLGAHLSLLNAVLHREKEKIRSFRSELGLDTREYMLLDWLSSAGLIDIGRKRVGERTMIKSMQVIPSERPFILDLLTRLQAVKDDEELAVEVTAGAIAMARSEELLGEIAMIGRRR